MALWAAQNTELKPEFPNAPNILRDNFYGWFDRVERGVYG